MRQHQMVTVLMFAESLLEKQIARRHRFLGTMYESTRDVIGRESLRKRDCFLLMWKRKMKTYMFHQIYTETIILSSEDCNSN